MDTSALITLIVGFLAVIGTNAGLFLWCRGEGNADRIALSETITNLTKEMKEEVKDFHGRLCTIEEKYNQMKLKEK